jgi:hypothetical protein
MVEVGIGICHEESCSGSRRALWNAVLNLIYASGGRRYLNVADDCYMAALESLFEEFLAPVAPYVDAELRYAAGELTRGVAIQHVRGLVEACLALERALDDPPS